MFFHFVRTSLRLTITLPLCIYMILKYSLGINRVYETSNLKFVSQASSMNRVIVGQNWC